MANKNTIPLGRLIALELSLVRIFYPLFFVL
jgi:hypothetical protein